ncbi:hypothetical protein BDF19DRAFT_410420 [Syncephalis fuscata]|nr:hypothetical protein BDF19DRAFT_410420 [Syncephalis fuscata]
MDSNSHGSLTSLKDIEAAATAAGISPNELQELFFSAKAQCPAFSQGCPYAKFTNIEAPAHNLTAQCPAFQNGCPFSHKSPEQVVELLRNVPHGHKACPALQHGKPSFTFYLLDTYKLLLLQLAEVNNLPTCSDGETLLNALQNLRLDLFVLDNGHDEENMPAPIALAQELRSGTAKFHRLAQRSAFIKRYTRGELDKEVYAQFLLSLHCVYSALEKALEQHKDHKGLKLIYFDDLHFYLGDSWQDRIGQVPKAAQAYADRLTELSKTNPNLLVAHSYTRYLGDLSVITQCSYLNYRHIIYEFHTIDDVNAFKDIYRAALNEIPVDNETRDAIVNEAKYAYELNVNVFEAHEHLLTANTAKRGQDDGQLRRSIGKYIAIGAWIAVAVAFLHHRGAFNALRK